MFGTCTIYVVKEGDVVQCIIIMLLYTAVQLLEQ